MARPIERVYRNRMLTKEEAARYNELRRVIEEEFPEAKPPPVLDAAASELLRKALRDSGHSADKVAAKAGLAADLVRDFLAGKRDIRTGTADRLASAVGLRIEPGTQDRAA